MSVSVANRTPVGLNPPQAQAPFDLFGTSGAWKAVPAIATIINADNTWTLPANLAGTFASVCEYKIEVTPQPNNAQGVEEHRWIPFPGPLLSDQAPATAPLNDIFGEAGKYAKLLGEELVVEGGTTYLKGASRLVISVIPP